MIYAKIRDVMYAECNEDPKRYDARCARAFEASDELMRALKEKYPGNFTQRYSHLFPKATAMLVKHFEKKPKAKKGKK